MTDFDQMFCKSYESSVGLWKITKHMKKTSEYEAVFPRTDLAPDGTSS